LQLNAEDKINALIDPTKGASWIQAQLEKYDADMKVWQEKFNQLQDELQSKSKAYADKIQSLPPGTLTC
jgi:hypothetical protein